MVYFSTIKSSVAGIFVLAVVSLTPFCGAQAQTSKKFGKALAKTIKGNYKELPSLKPIKEKPIDTSMFGKQNMKIPGQQKQQKSAPLTGVALGYGNSLLFKDMDKLKKDSLRRDTVNAEAPRTMR